MPTRRDLLTEVALGGLITAVPFKSKATNGATHPAAVHSNTTSLHIARTELSVSRLAYGCAGFGRWDTSPLAESDIGTADRAIHTAFDNGITLFDHADLYCFGKAEAAFGKVLENSPGLRHKLFVQSKCGQVFPEGWKAGDPVTADLSRDHIMRAVEGSLTRMATDRLDILLLHIADTLVEPEEVAYAFDALQRSGKVRHFGVSNYNASQIQLLRKAVRQPLIVNQIHLGLGHAYPIADGMEFMLQVARGKGDDYTRPASTGVGTFDYCRLSNIQIQAYSPLRDVVASTDRIKPEHRQVAALLRELANDKGVTPSAVALAWLMRHPAKIVPIIGALEPEHIVDNCAAYQVQLTHDEWYRLLVAAVDVPSPLP